MTLEPADLEDTFRRYHQFHDAITAANRAAQPKQSIWPSVAKLFVKAIPADLVRTMIVDGGKAILASRQRPAEEDLAVQTPKPAANEELPPVAPGGRPMERERDSRVSFVSTLEDDKPAPQPVPPQE